MKILIERVGRALNVANNASLYIAVLACVRQTIRKIGVQKVCLLKKKVDLHIHEGRATLPKDLIKIHDIYSAGRNFDGGRNMGFQISGGMDTGHRLEYQATNGELIFPNLDEGKIKIDYFYLPADEDGDIIIPDEITEACYTYCEYRLLNESRNTRDPKWQERRIMKQDALDEISDARGELNSSNLASQRTLRFLK